MRFFKNDIFSNPGSPERETYSVKVLDNGDCEIVISGKEDFQAMIDSYADSTDLRVLITRYNAGDLTALNQRQGTFGDFTNMPKTYAEFLQLQIDSNNLFNSLPVDIKNKFDNDPNKFFAQSGTKEWFDICSPVMSEEMRSMINPMEIPVEPTVDPVEKE